MNTSQVTNRRSRFLNKIGYVVLSQAALGSFLSLFCPSDVLKYPLLRSWTEYILSIVSPKLLTSHAGLPGLVLFYHSVMMVAWPFFLLAGIVILLAAPNGPGKQDAKSAAKVNTSKSTLLLGYALVALMLSYFAYFTSDGSSYMSENDYTNFHGFSAGSMLIASMWHADPREGLLVSSLAFALTTAIALVLATAPGVLKMYWDILPWFKKVSPKK